MSRARRPLAALLALALGGGGPATHAAPAAPARLTIVFTGDVSGYLEPCG